MEYGYTVHNGHRVTGRQEGLTHSHRMMERNMKTMNCRDKVRISFTDESGVLRVKGFNIVDAPQCRELAEDLRKQLLGKPLEDIDTVSIRNLSCAGNGLCGQVVANVIEECQSMFVRNTVPQ